MTNYCLTSKPLGLQNGAFGGTKRKAALNRDYYPHKHLRVLGEGEKIRSNLTIKPRLVHGPMLSYDNNDKVLESKETIRRTRRLE